MVLRARSDNLTRVVTVKTSSSIITRPITKISPLPIDHVDEDLKESLHKTVAANSICLNQESQSGTTSSMMKDQSIPNDRPMNKRKRKVAPVDMAHYNDGRVETRFLSPKKKTFWSIITLVMCLCVETTAEGSNISSKAFTTTTLKDSPGIFFEAAGMVNLVNHNWDLVMYFDLAKYWKESSMFKKSISEVRKLCLNNNVLNDSYSKSILTQLHHSIEDIEHINELIHDRNGPYTKRFKRSPFDFVGTVANKLFGILSHGDAEYFKDQILRISTNENHMLQLVNNQTSIQEGTVNFFRKSLDTIDDQFTSFKEHIKEIVEATNSIRNQTYSLDIKQRFNMQIIQLMMAMDKYKRFQNILLDMVMDTHHGKIHPLILKPVQLKKQLSYIREHVFNPLSLRIPGGSSDSDVLNIYQILTARTRITQQNIIFKIEIPLVGNINY